VFVLIAASIAVSPLRAEAPLEQAQAADEFSSSDSALTFDLQGNDDASVTQVVPASAEMAADEEEHQTEAGEAERVAKATATHHQTGVIDANVSGQPQVSLKCFCLTPDNRVLAGCVGAANEIRVFDAGGNYLASWSAPFPPDAIFARADGTVFLAGQGKLARLSGDGQVELERESPHAATTDADREQIREQVIAQAKQQAQMHAQQTVVYDKMLEQVDKQLAEIKLQIADLDEAGSAADDDSRHDEQSEAIGLTSERRLAMKKQMLERRLAMQERMKQQYEQAKQQWAAVAQQQQQPELTEEQIEQRINASIQYKLQASSISATEAEVFVATRSAVGHGFTVWRMNDQFTGGQQIITGLSGCCGQMDVKVNDDGLFVAENSRHRVCRYDRDGNLIGNWGHGARKGLEGFGSCCNPMNVAFGPGGAVYTSEDDTGRIKRYSPEGELLGLVGAVDLVPGCKNVSIAVNADGSRVYMMDITRNRVLSMEPFAPGEAPAPVPYDDVTQTGQKLRGQPNGSSDVGGALVDGLKSIFGLAK
jgi:sugar lactone lactonase YvrE